MDGISSRPQKFSEVIGQSKAKTLLANTLRTGKLKRAYLFSGPRSIGKTTLASIFGRALLCEKRPADSFEPCNVCASCTNALRDAHSHYTEVDAARYGTKENMSNLLDSLNYESVGFRVILLDEAHMISSAGKDAALKSLETPVDYDNTVFLFCTTEDNKMPPTLKSRCVRVPLEMPSPAQVREKLEKVCREHGVRYDAGSLRMLAEWSKGHYREAENALEPLVLMGGINYENVSTLTGYDVDAISSILINLGNNLAESLNSTESVCHRFGAETVQSSILRVLLEAFQYGLSGMKIDTYESVKKVYSTYGSQLSTLIEHFSSKGKMSDGRLIQSEIVQAYYKYIKGDLDTAMYQPAPSVASRGATGAASAGSQDRIAQQRADRLARRSKEGVMAKEQVVPKWGPETVSDTLKLTRE